jgi:hypothetical protein
MNMDSHERDVIIVARIPDLASHGGRHDGRNSHPGGGWRWSSGRWLSQVLSFRLLAGLTLCLLAAAVLPYVFGHSSAPAESPALHDSQAGWRSDSSNDFGNAKAAGRMAPKEATVVRAAPESPPPHRIAQREPSVRNGSASPADDVPNYSQWPNPGRVEYEADTRANPKSQATPGDGEKR